nr:hypothetical protein CFP56_78910 [Quercus suber]
MESSSMFVELEDFGQTDLTRRIREVLLNANLEGTTVLELIQNADDASATTVRLCLDRRPAYAQLWIPVAVSLGSRAGLVSKVKIQVLYSELMSGKINKPPARIILEPITQQFIASGRPLPPRVANLFHFNSKYELHPSCSLELELGLALELELEVEMVGYEIGVNVEEGKLQRVTLSLSLELPQPLDLDLDMYSDGRSWLNLIE